MIPLKTAHQSWLLCEPQVCETTILCKEWRRNRQTAGLAVVLRRRRIGFSFSFLALLVQWKIHHLWIMFPCVYIKLWKIKTKEAILRTGGEWHQLVKQVFFWPWCHYLIDQMSSNRNRIAVSNEWCKDSRKSTVQRNLWVRLSWVYRTETVLSHGWEQWGFLGWYLVASFGVGKL